MTLKAEILDCFKDSYQGKGGTVTTTILTLIDRGEGARLRNTVDLLLTAEQAEKMPTHDGKLVGKLITVAVTEVGDAFSKRFRIRGQVLEWPKV